MNLMYTQQAPNKTKKLVEPLNLCGRHLPQWSVQLWTLAVSSFPSVATLLSVQSEEEAGEDNQQLALPLFGMPPGRSSALIAKGREADQPHIYPHQSYWLRGNSGLNQQSTQNLLQNDSLTRALKHDISPQQTQTHIWSLHTSGQSLKRSSCQVYCFLKGLHQCLYVCI